jgi:hypothetical protein
MHASAASADTAAAITNGNRSFRTSLMGAKREYFDC